VITLALAGLIGGFVAVVARPGPPGPDPRARLRTIAAILLMGSAGVVLITQQPSGTGELALSLAAFTAGARLELRGGIVLVATLTAATATALAIDAPRATTSVASSVLLAALLFLMARLYRRAQEDRERAETAAAELADARERELEMAAIAERGRIARELHDVLAHSLSGLSLQLESARLVAERDHASPELQGLLARSRRLAADGLEDARRAVRALRGDRLPTLDDLQGLVADFSAGGLAVTLDVRGAPRAVSGETGLAVYRAAQEALTNVARHSGAGAAEVRLEFAEAAVRLRVTDRGAAGAPALTGVGSGYGLSAMRERVELLGGEVSAGPTDEGFCVELELPA
jgi:signal transduction histidine kinase